MSRTVIAVVTAFEPSTEIIDVIDRVIGQVDSVIVVDDGSPSLLAGADDRVRTILDTLAGRGATVIESPENSGIAHALNAGVRRALDRGADAVLTLDQDTLIESDYIEKVLAHLALADSLAVRPAMASPSLINDDVAPFWFAERGLTLAFEPIQSGLVITRETFDEVGLFEDELFIDCVETEFYLRARAHGAHALIVPGTRIAHKLGKSVVWTPPRLLRPLLRGPGSTPAPLEFSVDAPFRHYYIARNRLVLYRRYWRTEPLWCVVSVAKDMLSRGRAMLIGDARRSRIYLSLSGVWAALGGQTGRVPERTLRRAARL
ncbi:MULTISPECIES: glycosyltransferase [Gordonia]|jgi:glycosyltransferase involved in cell wall biosynthesis|uniref:glycosyltransferase n=1 Tax=Gordonia TaxID=2053 RepID=UPI001FEA5B6F|nr:MULTISPECIES: glycosyltransferase [Gordonia]